MLLSFSGESSVFLFAIQNITVYKYQNIYNTHTHTHTHHYPKWGIFCLPACYLNVYINIYRTIILPVVLCGCETWSVTLREEHRLRLSENRVLREIFGHKRDKVTLDWRRLHVWSFMIYACHQLLLGSSNQEE